MNFPQQTESIWSATAKAPKLPQLNGRVKVDVAIVGAGITGMTAAALLKRAGRSVAVIERDEFGNHGTTHRTSAHLTEALDESYPTLIRKFNEKTTRLAVDASRTAIDLIEQLPAAIGFDNQFRRVDGYRYTESNDQIKEIEDDYKAASKLGLDVELVSETPLPFKIRRGFRFSRQAQFHPLRHIFGLAKFVNGDGGAIFHKSPVRELENGKQCTLKTDHGMVIARDVILATHTPMGVWPTLQTRLVPYHSYCLAVRVKGQAPLGLFWDTEDPYHFIRRFAPQTGEGDDILIIGGADTKTGHERNTRKSFDQMERYARKRFNVKSIDYHWSDEFFEPADGLPYIGRAPAHKNVYVATGYSGTGLTYGTAAAMLISDLILNRKNPWEKAFSPSRVKPIASAKRTLEEVGATVKGLITDRFFKIAEKNVSRVKPNEGKVLSIGGHRVGVYRDEKGKLQAVSATCTHMGCLVEWNNAEKHWDCKCHGSLFKPDGEPFAGPASKPLERREINPEGQIGKSSKLRQKAAKRR